MTLRECFEWCFLLCRDKSLSRGRPPPERASRSRTKFEFERLKQRAKLCAHCPSKCAECAVLHHARENHTWPFWPTDGARPVYIPRCFSFHSGIVVRLMYFIRLSRALSMRWMFACFTVGLRSYEIIGQCIWTYRVGDEMARIRVRDSEISDPQIRLDRRVRCRCRYSGPPNQYNKGYWQVPARTARFPSPLGRLEESECM
jgi:hypothetical protein